ncbi:hypothetical protein FIBSPDRAFT_878439 [Athelia psychrophila]|uniref:Uncharacterized protein n=1 Tax=Athelia psychrophila TaxID=1759441 RepID=A0A167V108_9AGAM|nr:hypothetical protein FIBSPDRAFT_878439 [Fibularhizoctonia sp. CBS 109695]
MELVIGWFDLDMRHCDLGLWGWAGLSTQTRATEELGRLEAVASPVASPILSLSTCTLSHSLPCRAPCLPPTR